MRPPAVFLATVLACLAGAHAASAQSTAPPAQSPPQGDDEWKIIDNSFLVEEAFNQDPHVVQNIFQYQQQTFRDWQFTFTQEWPVPRKRHQLSYTIPWQSVGGTSGAGDVLINYRLQVTDEGDGRPAFAPRVSVIVPSGNVAAGADFHGLQVNLPFSKRQGLFYFHWNAGFTTVWSHDGVRLTSPLAAASVIYRARQMLNLMLEGQFGGISSEVPGAIPGAPPESQRVRAGVLSPGVRGGWDLSDDKQVVVGIAGPVSWTGGQSKAALLLYFSYEGPVKGLPRK
jgi:hypothetical protein